MFYDGVFDIMVNTQSFTTEGPACWRQEVLVQNRVTFWAHTAGGSYFPEWLFALAAQSSGCWRSGHEVEEEVVEDDEEDFPYHSDSSAPDTMLNGGGLENCNFSPWWRTGELQL